MTLSSNMGFNLSVNSGSVHETLIVGVILISVLVVSIPTQWGCH